MKVSSVGVGTWAWGDQLYWQYKDEDEKDAAEAFAASMVKKKKKIVPLPPSRCSPTETTGVRGVSSKKDAISS